MLNALRESIKGDLLDDMLSRIAYTSDASAYEILPRCIVLPKDLDDVVNVVRFAAKHKIPITPRGGGSSLAGQSIGEGIIIDFSRYMNKLLRIEDDYVEVQPGIYKGVLDQILSRYNKSLPPDPSSSNFCTIGGMVGTNASGAHTVKYGSIIDYVLELEVVLSDGSVINAKPIKEFDNSKEGKIANYIYNLLKPKLDLINQRFPKVSKNSCGYRIDRVITDCIDLSKLFVGAEGTLGIVTKIKLKIIDIPKDKALFLLGFRSSIEAASYVNQLLIARPSALEMIDKSIIDLARRDREFSSNIPEDINALLFVEFDDNNEMIEILKESDKCLLYSTNKDEIEQIWRIRKNALAYSMKIREDHKKPVAFMEDPVVNASKLVELVKIIESKRSLHYIAYGHAGDGNLHIRPLLDLTREDDLNIMKSIANEILYNIVRLNGSISAEHGDGLARSEFIRYVYGDEIYSIFKEIKQFLDPMNIMNPGKKIIDNSIFLNNLRYKEVKKNEEILNWGIRQSKIAEGITGYSKELSYYDEVELCHGCGACRELSYRSRMCPVYKGLNIEEASCRGRNNILRWLERLNNIDDIANYKEIIYKYCIQCKTCLYECPSNVNVGKIMAEARARYVKAYGLPKGYKYFVDIDRYASIGCKYAKLSNILINNRLFRLMLERFTNIDARKKFPRFAERRFDQLYKPKRYDKNVIFFYDTYINYNDPYLGLRIAEILGKNGYGLIIPKQYSSGLPAILEGSIDKGREIANYNINSLYEYAKDGIPIITFSPSASLALRMEYLNVIDNYKSRFIAENTYDIHEFLYMLYQKGELKPFNAIDDDILLHFHCHTLVLGVDKYVKALLRLIPSLKFSIIEKGCCGVGGSYSFIKDNYDLSMSIGRELFNAVKASDKMVYTTGESCKLQIEEGSNKELDLTINLIARAYDI